MTLTKAIKIIAWYCMKQDCDKCRLCKNDKCIREIIPCEWENWIKEK